MPFGRIEFEPGESVVKRLRKQRNFLLLVPLAAWVLALVLVLTEVPGGAYIGVVVFVGGGLWALIWQATIRCPYCGHGVTLKGSLASPHIGDTCWSCQSDLRLGYDPDKCKPW